MNWQIQQWTNKRIEITDNSKTKLILLTGLFLVVFGLGFLIGSWRLKSSLNTLAVGKRPLVDEQLVTVVTKPTLVLGQLKLLVKPVEANYYLNVVSGQEVTVNPGDEIKISGELKEGKGSNAKDLSFSQYEQSQMIAGQIKLMEWEMVEPASWFNFRYLTFVIQTYLYSLADQLWPYPHNILTLGVLVGRNDFPADLKQTFRVAGLSHIVVLSGFNLSIVVNALYAIYIDRLRYLKAGTGLIVAILLAAVSGFGASALRALVMVAVAIYAKLSGRTYLAFRALIFTVAILSLWRPLMFLFDVGFQLSVLATSGLIWLSEPVANYLTVKGFPKWLAELIGGTIAAEIFVLPWLSLKFGQIATYGLLANVLVLPTVPLLMVLSFGTLILASISVVVAYPLSLITYLTSAYIINLAKLINWLPFSSINFTITWLWVVGWYMGLFYYLIYQHKKLT